MANDSGEPESPDGETADTRRAALGKLGKYGAVTGIALLGMMTATKAPAASPPPP